MIDIAIVMLIAIQFFLLLTATYLLMKKPFDIGTIMVLLSILFYFFPAWDFYFGGSLFTDIIVNYRIGIENDSEGIYLIFITTLIMATFYFGYLVIGYLIKEKRIFNFSYRIDIQKYRLAKRIILLTWLIVFIYSFSRYDQSILLFFSPSRKQGVFESAYIGSVYKILPVSFFIIEVIKDFFERGKIKRKTLLLVIFPILAYMTTGQRREIINLIILVVTLLIHIKIEGKDEVSKNKSLKYKRKKIFQLGFLSILLIPILWWGRVVFSQLQRNSTEIIAPWKQRGFMELIFGSSSGGFKTLLLGLEHKEKFDVPWGYSIYFFLSSFVPREIMPNKPLIINRLWQIDLDLSGNPSIFFINEMYINFGISSIVFSMIFGMTLSYIFNKLYKSNNLIKNIYSFIIFSNVITLFKNGFVQFTISTLMTIIIIGFPCNFIIKKTEGEW